MTTFLIDTNVIVDVLSRDPRHGAWSRAAIARCTQAGSLAINPVIYAELAAGMERIESIEAALPAELWERLPIPWPAAFLAGRAFRTYRDRGGARTRTLPDFVIGAHAATSELTLVTRDATRYRTYFPTVALVAP